MKEYPPYYTHTRMDNYWDALPAEMRMVIEQHRDAAYRRDHEQMFRRVLDEFMSPLDGLNTDRRTYARLGKLLISYQDYDVDDGADDDVEYNELVSYVHSSACGGLYPAWHQRHIRIEYDGEFAPGARCRTGADFLELEVLTRDRCDVQHEGGCWLETKRTRKWKIYDREVYVIDFKRAIVKKKDTRTTILGFKATRAFMKRVLEAYRLWDKNHTPLPFRDTHTLCDEHHRRWAEAMSSE